MRDQKSPSDHGPSQTDAAPHSAGKQSRSQSRYADLAAAVSPPTATDDDAGASALDDMLSFAAPTVELGQSAPLGAPDAGAAARDGAIAFASSTPAPRQVGHELAHAVQQRRGAAGAPVTDRDTLESEADGIGDALARGDTPPPVTGAASPDSLLLDGESDRLPPPIVMQVVGDRFLVSFERQGERGLTLDIRYLGQLETRGDAVRNGRLRLTVPNVSTSPFNGHLAAVEEDSLVVAPHGDRSRLIRLSDFASPSGAMNNAREHRFLVRDNGDVAAEGTLEIVLPSTVNPEDAAADPELSREQKVERLIPLGGDGFRFSARRFGDTDRVVLHMMAAVTAEALGSEPTVSVPIADGLGSVTLERLNDSDHIVELDLNGDGEMDARLVHTMFDSTPERMGEPWRLRTHHVRTYDRSGQLLAHNRHDQWDSMDSGVVHDPIPSDQLETGVAPPSTAPPIDELYQEDNPGEASVSIRRLDGHVEVRVDADGDRSKELALHFYPESCVDDHHEYRVDVLQVSSGEVASERFRLSGTQAEHFGPMVERYADGANPLVLSLVRQDTTTAPPAPAIMEIDPPVDGPQRRYDARIAGTATSFGFSPETAPTRELVQGEGRVNDVGGVQSMEVALGEFGDRFRFTFEAGAAGSLMGVSALNPNGPGSVRAVRLVEQGVGGGLSCMPHGPTEFVFGWGLGEVVVNDAIHGPVRLDHQETQTHEQGTVAADPLVERTHTISITGSALESPRQFEFHFHHGQFQSDEEQSTYEADRAMGPLNELSQDGHEQALLIHQELISRTRAMDRATDHGLLDDRQRQTWYDLALAMVRLRTNTDRAARTDEEVDEALRNRAVALHETMRDGLPPGAPTFQLSVSETLLRSSNWASFTSFGSWIEAWGSWVETQLASDVAHREAVGAALAVDTLQQQLDAGSVRDIRLRFDAALGQDIVRAHREWGFLDEVGYQGWDQLKQAMIQLRLQASAEEDAQMCLVDPALVTNARDGSRALADNIEGAPQLVGWATTLDNALDIMDWALAGTAYDAMMRSLDEWVTARITERFGTDSDEYRTNRYAHQMRDQVADLEGEADVMRVAATFVPDESYRRYEDFHEQVPLQLYVFRSGGEWKLRDITNPENTFEDSVTDQGEEHPPHALFEKLDYIKHFPRGLIRYQVPGGPADRVVCEARKEWWMWARDIGLALAVIGIAATGVGALFEVGAAATIGGWFLAGAGVAQAVGAGGELAASLDHGYATGGSIAINVLEIIAGLASAGQLVAGNIVRGAASAEAAWTGRAAMVASYADKAYIPLTAAAMGADVLSLAALTYDMVATLQRMEESGASQQEVDEARAALITQLCITGGLTILSIHGDAGDLAGGRRIVLDVIDGVPIARPAGVTIAGARIDVDADDAATHATARWHARDLERARAGGNGDVDGALGDEELMGWYRDWARQPDKIEVRPDGSYEIKWPTREGEELAEPMRARLRQLIEADIHDLVHYQRAMDQTSLVEELRREAGSDINLDPMDPDWPRHREALVERLGGGRDAEAMVTRFETARGGALGDDMAGYMAQREQINTLLPDNELQRINNMFPEFEVYVTGAASRPGADIGPETGAIEVEVVVPNGTPPDVIAAIEARGELLRLRPDPRFLQQHGLDANHTIGVEVRAMTGDQFFGMVTTAGRGSAHLRIDQVLEHRQLELEGYLDQHLRQLGVDPAESGHRVEMLSEEEFATRFGSGESGRSVFQVVDGQPVIYARPDAGVGNMLDEATHIAQLRDPNMASHIRQLDEANLENWAEFPAQQRLELFQTKLTIEIDARERALVALRAEETPPVARIEEAEANLGQLRDLQEHISTLTPEQLSMMNAGQMEMPAYLDQPSRLFGKSVRLDGNPLDRFELPEDVARSGALPRTPSAEYSAAYGQPDVESVVRVGDSWREHTLVTSGYNGTVHAIDTAADGSRTVVIRTENGGEHAYTVEPGADLRVATGDEIDRGATLAEESAREYRLVEMQYRDGRTDMREEIKKLDDTGWIQRGSESTRRGAIMEDAARRQVDQALSTSGVPFARLPHRRGGGGFDDVVVEFTGSGSSTQAHIRIIEVKDYPNRSVPLEEFTAIRGDGLRANLTILETNIADAIAASDAGLPLPRGFEGLTGDQLSALQRAFENNDISVELMLGPTTRLGATGHHASTVLPRLREDVDGILGPGSLRGDFTPVEQSHVDDAINASTPQATGTDPP